MNQATARRRLRRLALSAFALVALGTIAVYTLFIMRDIEPPDDADLLLPAHDEVPDAENGYLRLVAIAEAMPDFPYEWIDPFAGHPAIDPVSESLDVTRADAWQDSALRERALEVFELTRASFVELETALALPSWQPPPLEAERSSALSRLREHAFFRFEVLVLEGRSLDALDEAKGLFSIGGRLGASARSSLDLFSAWRLDLDGLQALALLCELREIEGRSIVREADLIATLASLPQTRTMALNNERVVKAEFQNLRRAILATEPSFTFKPYRTLAVHADNTRRFLRDLRRPLLEYELEPAPPDSVARGTAVLSGNSIGEELRFLVTLEQSFFSRHWTEHLWHLETMRLLLATEIYRHQRGTLPPTLDALVPAILPMVPRDPYDGQPMRYDAERGVIWSIGSDGVDSGGLPGGNLPNFDHTEPTLSLPLPPK